MLPNELAIMPGNRCILQLHGVHPFYSRKYDITKHPMYSLLADADEGNRFGVRRVCQKNYK
jgi:type IV secretion system protein VirD4